MCSLIMAGALLLLSPMVPLGGGLQAASPTALLPGVAGEHPVALELATTPEARARGLMFRQRLGPHQGMLFLYPDDAERPFWMKNVPIALDMVFLDGHDSIVAIHSAAPCVADPCPLYHPGTPIRRVLELRGGLARQLRLQPGMRLRWRDLPPGLPGVDAVPAAVGR